MMHTMNLHDDGRFEPEPGLSLWPGMRAADLLAQGPGGEEWLHHEGRPVAWRKVFDARGGKKPEKTVLIATFAGTGGPLARWDIAPWHLMDGEQRGPDGPRTRALREWFQRRHGVVLPTGGEWGHVDAAHDPHNQVSLVVCDLREGFASERDWQAFRNRHAR